jgi:glycosyltransferase involved in cell wall biosynthesis
MTAAPGAGSAPASSRSPLRIVRVVTRLNVGGPARHVALLEAHLPALGYTSWLVHGALHAGEQELPVLSGSGHDVVRLESLGRRVQLLSDVSAFLALVRLLFRLRPDIVHTHTAKAGTLGRLAAVVYNGTRSRARRAVVLHTFHGHVFEGYFSPRVSRVVERTERLLARCTDRIVAISPLQRRDLVERFRIAPADRVAVVPLGLDLSAVAVGAAARDSARAAMGFPPDAVVCAYVGRLVPIKHVDLLVRACARAFAASPLGQLLVVGDGECRSVLERLASESGLDGRVIFTGWRTDLGAVYAAADLVALTSRNEGTPVALIEALAAGRPVVATDVGGVRDVVSDGRTGRLVPDDDEDALVRVLADLIGNAAERDRLGAAGPASVLERFGYPRLVTDLDRIYREAIAAGRSGRRSS